jgi:hypothetical protein
MLTINDRMLHVLVAVTHNAPWPTASDGVLQFNIDVRDDFGGKKSINILHKFSFKLILMIQLNRAICSISI